MTIKDIARMSGVGVATVSRVLNHHPDVSEDWISPFGIRTLNVRLISATNCFPT